MTKVIIDKNTVLPADMTQEDLDDLLKLMQELADSGKLEEMSIPLDMEELKEREPELYNSIMQTDEVTEQ